MLLYLIRHAHAVPEEENALRPLSPRGRETAEWLAAFFRANAAWRPRRVWHSPLVRARETAEILARGLDLDPRALTENPHLLPDGDPAEIAHRVERADQDLALVGHDPHLSALATLLVCGPDHPAAFELKKGAVLCLESIGQRRARRGGGWCVRWYVNPGLLPAAPGATREKP